MRYLITLAFAALFSFSAYAQGTGGTGNQLSIQGLMTLTTNGSSGASTLTGKTLNIPIYTGGGGGSVAISNTTSNVTYRPLFATGTSASAATIYIDGTSPWSYNASTGLTSILGVTTTALTVNGNTSLGGTTTATNLVVTTTLTDTAMASGLVISTTGVLSSTTTIPAAYRPVGGDWVRPTFLYTTDTSNTITPGIYAGAGGNASANAAGYSFAGGVSSGTIVLGMWFKMPSLIPQGTFTFDSDCLTSQSLTSGSIKYTLSDADVASGASPSAATLTAETQTSLGATTTDFLQTTYTSLTHSTPVANDIVNVALQLNATGTPPTNCSFYVGWK